MFVASSFPSDQVGRHIQIFKTWIDIPQANNIKLIFREENTYKKTYRIKKPRMVKRMKLFETAQNASVR